jgi:sugar lactone lactonase YvrE
MQSPRILGAALFVSLFAIGCADSPVPTGPGASKAIAPLSSGQSVSASIPRQLVTGLQELQGSAVGPGGALFVTAPLTGSIWRIDPKTGARTLFATGLPPRVNDPYYVGSGVVDVAFIGGTAYALVTGVGPDFGGTNVVGIYRVDSPTSATVVADLGAFSIANPPATPVFIPSGYQYAIEPYRGGFLVTDGHHNRVLRVTLDGTVTEFRTFGNVVPTGLDVSGESIFVALAGPIPHMPQDGQVVTFAPGSTTNTLVASGAPLLVDVELGRGRTLFALAQGFWNGPYEGAPADPNTGSLVRVAAGGTFDVVAAGLDRPTALEIIGDTAYVVTLGGEVWAVSAIAAAPFGWAAGGR